MSTPSVPPLPEELEGLAQDPYAFAEFTELVDGRVTLDQIDPDSMVLFKELGLADDTGAPRPNVIDLVNSLP